LSATVTKLVINQLLS